jgi:hypothetical protein
MIGVRADELQIRQVYPKSDGEIQEGYDVCMYVCRAVKDRLVPLEQEACCDGGWASSNGMQ